MQHLIRRFLNNNFKSSPKFGRIAVSSNSVREIFRERRFLYFTKKGPIEIVFNLKHYVSAFVLSIVFVIKLLQFIFFGISSFFNYVSFKNDEIVRNKFILKIKEKVKNKNINIFQASELIIDYFIKNKF